MLNNDAMLPERRPGYGRHWHARDIGDEADRTFFAGNSCPGN